jgi:hypothetical protein
VIQENSLSRLFEKRVCESPFMGDGGFTNTDSRPRVLRITIHYHTLKENIPARKFGKRYPAVHLSSRARKMGANIVIRADGISLSRFVISIELYSADSAFIGEELE